MKITSIQRQSSHPRRFNIYVDEAYAFSVHEDVLVRIDLYKGMIVEQDDIQRMIRVEELNRATHHALHYLKFRARSKNEIQQYLARKGYEEKIVSEVIQDLIAKKYIDDRQFAEQWTRYRMLEQSKGKKYVTEELKQKGIDSQWIEQALDTVDEEAEINRALSLAEKRWNRYKNEEWSHVQRKVGQYLLRQGYSGSIVYDVLNKVKDRWANQNNRSDENDSFH